MKCEPGGFQSAFCLSNCGNRTGRYVKVAETTEAFEALPSGSDSALRGKLRRRVQSAGKAAAVAAADAAAADTRAAAAAADAVNDDDSCVGLANRLLEQRNELFGKQLKALYKLRQRGEALTGFNAQRLVRLQEWRKAQTRIVVARSVNILYRRNREKAIGSEAVKYHSNNPDNVNKVGASVFYTARGCYIRLTDVAVESALCPNLEPTKCEDDSVSR